MAANNMIVQNNIAALNVHRNMKNVGSQQMKASERLSSGYKINRASDDAAGLAISEKMRGQIRGLNMASKNVDDAISLVKTAEGGMQGIDDMLHRIRELLDFGSNDTNENNTIGTGDRQKVQDEIDQLVEEIDSMSDRVEYNKKKLIDGSWQDTSSQLANAKGLVDTLDLEMTKASATSAAKALAQGTAQGTLTTATSTLETATGTYKTNVATMQSAQAAYDTLANTYEAAKAQLNNVLDKFTLSSDFSTWTAQTVGSLNSDAKALVANAIMAYDKASVALGVDEMNIQSISAAAQPTIIDPSTVTAAVPAGTAYTVTAIAANHETNFNDAFIPANAKAGIATLQTAQTAFSGQEAVYQAAVDAKNIAQDSYNMMTEDLKTAQTEYNNVRVRQNAANVSLRAASELDNAKAGRPLHFQVGANGGQSLFMSIGSLKSNTLGIGDGKGNTNIDVLKDTGASITATIDVLDQALSYVTTERSKLGAAVNRMEYTQQSLDITSENLSDAEARIRDADMAEEMMNKTKADTLQQVSVAMMSQANQQPQSILQLLR